MKICQMMSWTNKILIITLLFLFISLTGLQSCGERTLIRHYYILEVPEENYKPKQDTLGSEGICEILRVRIPPAYDQLRIAVRKRSHEISFYQYHYWAMNPADNLTSLLEKEIKYSNIFTYAGSENLKKIPDFQIATTVYKLEVTDTDDQFNVNLEMRMELIEYKSGKTVLNHQFERTKALENRDLNLFASELSIIFHQETDQFIIKINKYLENKNLQNSANK